MVAAIQHVPESIDPRVRRTRQMLHEALQRLLESNSIDKISVGDIAEEATLNRATFYGHYPDKFALLEGLVASRFQELVNERGVVFQGGCPMALRRITLAMCDYLAGLPSRECPNQRQMDKHFESAVVAVVRGMILDGLKKHSSTSALPPELIAATTSGAIYAAAREWLQTPDRVPVEEIVESISTLISPMLTTS